MRRTIALAIAAAAVVGAVVAGAPAPVGAAGGAADDHRRVVEFWTPENRARAIPLDVVLGGGPDGRRKPAPGGGGGGGSGGVIGATWTGGGQVAKTTGKVFFTENGTRYTCSGSAVDAGGVNVVLTAGHCVHGGTGGAFVTDWIFYPEYGANPSSPPWGGWTATDLFTTTVWTSGTNTTKWNDDAGFAVVYQDGNTSLGVLGTLPSIAFSEQAPSTVQTSFGYPAAKQYSGTVLTYCEGTTKLTYDNSDTYGMACNMTGGSSGGPWFSGFPGGPITSLNSYGYASLKNVMFGPVFDTGEQAAYNAACTGDCSVASSTCVSYA